METSSALARLDSFSRMSVHARRRVMERPRIGADAHVVCSGSKIRQSSRIGNGKSRVDFQEAKFNKNIDKNLRRKSRI